ncbi:ABC transporter permease [Brevibacillus choshinensis]|uniref:ABC transporter permease n=1 Tax=Brevibacillus choshinensis TaxID=54911 RepID=A0ABX7FKP2_BRECH|nr:ABC transporter permease [Brevibacillus choshinensis]QRG66796.1 ABC transporter permease [Brevibacillus choshinensis]
MAKYIIRRILIALPTMFITLSIIFFSLRILPGDPALAILGEGASEEVLAKLREQMGLNVPVWQQYVNYLAGIFRGDFGESISTGKPVSEMIQSIFPHTMRLAIGGLIVGCVIGIPLGILSAIKQNTTMDNAIRFIAMIGISFPPFFLAILFMVVFSLKIELFPSMGAGETFMENLYHLVLPSLTLGVILGAILMRFVRSSMLDEINQDYVRTARSKGASEKLVIYKHVLRNSLIPVITVIGLDITALLSGAILTETIYSRPGLGSMAVGAIVARDFPTLQGCLVLFTILVVGVNLVVDVSYSLVNPKIRPS